MKYEDWEVTTDDLIPMDKPEDMTTGRLFLFSHHLEYGGRAKAAEVVRWCAERIEYLEKEFEKVRAAG